MHIRSLNVSMPIEVEHKGESVNTGIFKRAMETPRMARTLNIEGDGQADLTLHGGVHKAVYAFPQEHYAFFQSALRQQDYEPGQFGENLTTEGMLETEVRIGDRYRVGQALFEVSQPRSPCYKFAIRMGAAEALLVMIESARTGFYLRVLEEGMIAAADEIKLEYRDAGAPSVDEIHRLYYLDRKNVEGLTRAANCERLGPAFADDLRARLAKLRAKS